MANILIIGATSAIATACGRQFAKRGDSLYLLARNEERLDALSRDLDIRGASSVHVGILDVSCFAEHESQLEQAMEQMSVLDVVLIAHGTLPDQKQCQKSAQQVCREFEINALSTISLLTILANQFEKQKKGVIAVIGSVAGDRGRQSNYVYGCAKSAIEVFLQGLRNRLHGSGVGVLIIKPGFVDTPMTEGFTKGFLWVEPGYVARDIVKAIDSRKSVCYTPWFWRWIMLVIRNIPEKIFIRMRL